MSDLKSVGIKCEKLKMGFALFISALPLYFTISDIVHGGIFKNFEIFKLTFLRLAPPLPAVLILSFFSKTCPAYFQLANQIQLFQSRDRIC